MKQILRITVGLTISCLVAAFVMGAVFTVTDKAKKHNEHLNVQQTMLGLLGYSRSNTPPSGLRLYRVYRYIIEEAGDKYMGYMVPLKDESEAGHELLILSLLGNLVAHRALDISPEKAMEAANREKALRKILKPPKQFSYADTTVIATLGERRIAYLLLGEFPGFKTFIKVMLALDPDFKIIGLDIMENEEDPGLGGDIEKEYFRNQFKNKTFENVKTLKVIKEPLPAEYRRALETKKCKEGTLLRQEIERIRSKYQDQDIYALTGATISSEAVTEGVKNMLRKFAYRLKILDSVIEAQDIQAAF